ncbi:MAG: TonB-dependent receptor [Pseudomonadota bacterium]
MSKRSLRFSVLTSVAFSALSLAGTVHAQETDTDEDIVEVVEEEVEEARQERVVVTGSLLRRDEFSSASPIQVITAETANLKGLLNATDVLQSASVSAGSTQINGNFGGFVVEGGTGVNTISLRGLGPQRTLVLLNGSRIGPSGTQGQVGAVDLNVIPGAAVERFDILKDSSSTIYGSDAVAGVVNLITRRQMDGAEINFDVSVPFEGGGEVYTIDGAFGLNFDRGSIFVSGMYEFFDDLSTKDRDFLACQQDYLTDPDTNERTDPIDPDTGDFQCFNQLNDAADQFTTSFGFVGRYFFDESAGTYVPRTSFLDNEYNHPRDDNADVIPTTERASIFAAADYNLGFADFAADFVYTNRTTEQNDSRQYFPFQSPADPLTFIPGFFNRPISVVPFDTEVEIDFYQFKAALTGDFGVDTGVLSTWGWETAFVYSDSTGDYTRDTIPLNRANDVFDDFATAENFTNPDGTIGCRYVPEANLSEYFSITQGGFNPNGTDPNSLFASCPAIDYYTREFLSGNQSQTTSDFLFAKDVGQTTYTQTTFTATAAGDVFELPAGAIKAGLGVEYREFELDDQPGTFSRGYTWTEVIGTDADGNDILQQNAQGNQWGLSSSVATTGEDNVFEVFGELEVPIFAGQPFAEELNFNISGRAFEYDSGGSDSIVKYGLNWQINPTMRVRATSSEAYRAPALYELFLGNQTSFANQLTIDPCDLTVDAAGNLLDTSQQNPVIRDNCVDAAGGALAVPAGFTPGGSSAEVTSGGGGEFLEPETSDSLTVGFIYTPTWADLSIALDYFEVEINDQIAQLSSAGILSGCYASENFPNDPLCSLFVRGDGGIDDDRIVSISDSFVNINSQTTRGLDLTLNFEREFDFGDISFDTQATWTFEDEFLLFSGTDFEPNDFNGEIGQPDLVLNTILSLDRGDFRYSWFTDFTSRMSEAEEDFVPVIRGGDFFKAFTEPQWYHGASVRYTADTWRVTAGIDNIFDEAPPFVSDGVATRRGNTPLVTTQFDYRGRTAFLSVSKAF